MTAVELKKALASAETAAQGAGELMRRNWRKAKVVNAAYAHDIKLELDVRCQKLITRQLRKDFPEIAILGEEGITGNPEAVARWVVDPIDGTVNFAYGIPHACVSIALQVAVPAAANGRKKTKVEAPAFQTVVGVVYDPFCDEMWTAAQGKPARLNGKPTHASTRKKLAECVISLGFGKHDAALQKLLPDFQKLAGKVRKIRVMGAAALDLVYVASGRLDAYLESGVRLWDIAAGGFILEQAGGHFWHQPIPGTDGYQIRANNGLILPAIDRLG